MKAGSIGLFGAAAVLGMAVYECFEHGVPVRRGYDVSVPEELAGLRILFLSDLHCNPFVCNNERIFQRLRKERPDVILLAGDMINKYGKKQNGRAAVFIKKLRTVAPVVYSLGNHEETLRINFPKQYEAYMKELKDAGVLVLDNETASLVLQEKNVEFAGLTLKQEYLCKGVRRMPPKEAFEELFIPNPERTVLLAHIPDFFPAYAKRAVLTVSGHNHGGIIRLPFIGGIISPQFYFPPYTRGCYRIKRSTLVVNAGIGSHSLPARLFNRIEYCVITTKSRETL
ncbi:MAG: metallophosphoesterase [Lachnospiraceae bacterium]|nr:metallophosphoesterase [Lachnospiraceae bacterium]